MWHLWSREDVFTVFVGKPERKKPLGRPRHRWQDDIKVSKRKNGTGVEWTGLAQGRDK
jgi:hypothetical protein